MKKRVTVEKPCQPEVELRLPMPLLSSLKAVKEGFFELCVRVGEQALQALMEQDRTELCGPKWSRDGGRRALRGGSTSSEISLGGRQIGVRRLRAATVGGEELSLPSFVWAAQRDPLEEQTWRAMVAGVSTRSYAEALEPLPADYSQRSTSSSSISRRFIALSQQRLIECLSRPLAELDLWVVMIDGIEYRDHTILVTLGIDGAGNKHVLGLREGSTENAGVAAALLSNLIERGLSMSHPILFVIDGSKALRKAIREVFGELGVVARCQLHKIRNVLDHLPNEMHVSVRRAMSQAYETAELRSAQRQLERLARSIESQHPGAAASLREGLEETLTLQRLGVKVKGALWKTLRSTNPIENLNGAVAHFTRNVRRWRSGTMMLRWVGSAILEAEKNFRRIRGYRELPSLIAALRSQTTSKEVAKRQSAA
jgi:transposase-like protein